MEDKKQVVENIISAFDLKIRELPNGLNSSLSRHERALVRTLLLYLDHEGLLRTQPDLPAQAD